MVSHSDICHLVGFWKVSNVHGFDDASLNLSMVRCYPENEKTSLQSVFIPLCSNISGIVITLRYLKNKTNSQNFTYENQARNRSATEGTSHM
jgi:hypothetical protein